MHFSSHINPNEIASFKSATLQGQASNKGLFVPELFPLLPASFWKDFERKTVTEIGTTVLRPFVGSDLSPALLERFVEETLNFPIPVVPVADDVFVLELFHGPTMAFKDVGARFLARCLGAFAPADQPLTVLVATSGDTGSAVAHGFYNVPNVNVKILFPKGKVSPFQEHQMTSLGGNIQAFAVEGTFDSCQSLVKEALQDRSLQQQVPLTSANSINIARLLPQMVYYFLAVQQIQRIQPDRELVVSVPCGNLGNLTAGLYAKRMGLPIHRFVAATNANTTFADYLNGGSFDPRPSRETCSNAMDVGNPSNFGRIQHLYNQDYSALTRDVRGVSFDDPSTRKKIADGYQNHRYILDPHGAVGLLGLENQLQAGQVGLFLATAKHSKFESVVHQAIPEYTAPSFDPKDRIEPDVLPNDYRAFRDRLEKSGKPNSVSATA